MAEKEEAHIILEKELKLFFRLYLLFISTKCAMRLIGLLAAL